MTPALIYVFNWNDFDKFGQHSNFNAYKKIVPMYSRYFLICIGTYEHFMRNLVLNFHGNSPFFLILPFSAITSIENTCTVVYNKLFSIGDIRTITFGYSVPAGNIEIYNPLDFNI